MKLLKLSDLVMQVAILAGGLAWYIFSETDYGLFIPYFAMAGWQLVSFFIHFLLNPAWLSISYRIAYGKAILWTFIIGLLCYMTALINLPFIFYLPCRPAVHFSCICHLVFYYWPHGMGYY